MGKSIISYATNPTTYLFSLGKGGEASSLFKNFKILKEHPSEWSFHNPSKKLVSVHPVYLWHTTKIVQLFCIEYMYFPIFPQILSFSSNRKAQNSAPSFQFMTPGRELTQKSTKSTKFQHFQLLKEMKLGPHQNYSPPRTSDLAKSEQNDPYFPDFPVLALNDPNQKSMNFIA